MFQYCVCHLVFMPLYEYFFAISNTISKSKSLVFQLNESFRYCPQLPKVGETIHGTEFKTAFGGKGANQCVAAAKLGGSTSFVGRVGDDIWGKQYIENFKKLNVDSTFVNMTPNVSTGIAQINVSESGDNQIVIVAGANNYLNKIDVEKAKEIIENAAVVICQLETSQEVAIRTLELCKGVTILNAAPACSYCDPKLFTLPTIFCVNECEASICANTPVASVEQMKVAIEVLLSKGCNMVILTMGDKGCMIGSKSSPNPKHIPTKSVRCIDSTGAGDAFIGSLAYLIANRSNYSLEKCIEIATFVASDSVTRLGTQTSFAGPEILEHIFQLK
ncbi:hypothetical protein FQA39_LY03234 [Lamprigera yunnana]|nr:hypothetical protein FQA39_LY03234 [Lamprigera yunnana]